MHRFRGAFEQTPPAYSAKNIDGERSYELARKAARSAEARSAKADAPARPQAVPVTARHLDVLSFDGETARLSMQVTAGFYVRSLAHDLGEALGCGAVLIALRRTRSGEFGLEPAVPLAEVLQSSREQLAAKLVPMAALLADLPSVTLRGQANLERLKNGVEMGPSDLVTPLARRSRAAESCGCWARRAIWWAWPRPAKTPGFLHGWVVGVLGSWGPKVKLTADELGCGCSSRSVRDRGSVG